MIQFTISTSEFNEALKLCERAEKLGLEFIKNKKTGEYRFCALPHDKTLRVEVQKYEITTWNRKGNPSQGHTILEVWRRRDAEALAGCIDAYISDCNPERYTEVSKSKFTSVNIEELKFFISRHSKTRK